MTLPTPFLITKTQHHPHIQIHTCKHTYTPRVLVVIIRGGHWPWNVSLLLHIAGHDGLKLRTANLLLGHTGLQSTKIHFVFAATLDFIPCITMREPYTIYGIWSGP